jgi:YfiH family protein
VSEVEWAFDLPGGGSALFTARAAGNLSSVRGTDTQLAAAAREALRERLGVRRIARGRQVHGAVVARASERDDGAGVLAEADGLATACSQVAVMVLTADCVPVALGGPGAVAMVHAGWRGIAAGVLEQGVLALRKLGCGEEIAAVVGPGAGPCCYEVGPEVHAALGGELRRATIDLQAASRERLRGAGVRDVRSVAACTICDERFFSHRREGPLAGRQGGLAWRS